MTYDRPGPDLPPPDITDEELEGLPEEDLAGPAFDLASLGPRRVLPAEDEPSAHIAWYLFPTERFRGEWRRHWVYPAGRLMILAIYAYLLTRIVLTRVKPQYVDRVMLVLIAVIMLLVAHRLADWYFCRFCLTNKRLLLVRGVFTRRVSMVPLLRVTDMRYVQSTAGRALNYGTFHVDGVARRNGLRRVEDLPNPNELYLRIVEELYEPQAVEARLGLDEESTEILSTAFHDALRGPALVNYDGWVSVEIFQDDRPVEISADRAVRLARGVEYRLVVTISREPAGRLAEPLMITGGVDEPTATFTVEVDSDRSGLRQPGVPVEAGRRRGASTTFTLALSPGQEPPSWAWIRVAQGRRTVQSIELSVTATGAGEFD